MNEIVLPGRTGLDLRRARINTAGAYICIEGLYLFALGIRPYRGRIPVVRLGGHREGEETGWQCARREVREESGLRIELLAPRLTYLSDGDQPETRLCILHWPAEDPPLLATTYVRDGETVLSLMYLARAQGSPCPSGEVKGLVLLKQDEVCQLCREEVTLEAYLERGGQAILQGAFDRRMILQPFLQLRLLCRILSEHPQLETV